MICTNTYFGVLFNLDPDSSQLLVDVVWVAILASADCFPSETVICVAFVSLLVCSVQ